jgi:hypothetical protein
MKIKNLEIALVLFEEAAIKHAEATEQGDYKTGNKNYKDIAKVIEYLKLNNQLLSLKQFLNNSSVGVRMWSATYLLPLIENESLKVLNEISNMQGIHSLTAKTTISEWQKGNLKL